MDSEKLASAQRADEIALAGWLRKHGVPVEHWGAGDAKTVGQLLAELRDGDCRLTVRRGSVVIRHVRAVRVTVTASRGGRLQRVVESHQVFIDDGRVRRRPGYLVGEKLKDGEDPFRGAIRALREELSITERVALIYIGHEAPTDPASTQDYPGLDTSCEIHRFSCHLPDRLVKDAYIEHGHCMTTTFGWEDCDQ